MPIVVWDHLIPGEEPLENIYKLSCLWDLKLRRISGTFDLKLLLELISFLLVWNRIDVLWEFSLIYIYKNQLKSESPFLKSRYKQAYMYFTCGKNDHLYLHLHKKWSLLMLKVSIDFAQVILGVLVETILYC